jgi:L-lactate dehydrogenase complex protein LldG
VAKKNGSEPMSDRENILNAVRKALESTGDAKSACTLPELSRPRLEGTQETLIGRFIEEVEAVSGRVHRLANIDSAARQLETLIRAGKTESLAVSRDPIARAISSRVLGRHVVVDPEDNQDAIAEADMGLTGVRLAIAEHGTLMLAPEDDHGRLAALLPPHHVAVLAVSQLVGTLAEAIEHLASDSQPATITFVSGPSRTADIEQTLVIGIHGPALLDILLIEDTQEEDHPS